MKNRGSGILLHISSLPSPYGVGDLGPQAYAFVDFLSKAKQSYWQILPLNPTDLLHDNSPYRSVSAFAFNPLFISPDFLVRDGLIDEKDLNPLPKKGGESIDYQCATEYKKRLFKLAFKNFQTNGEDKDYDSFCEKNSYWLEDYALFQALKEHFNGTEWSDWPVDIRDRKSDAINALKPQLTSVIELEKFLQYIFLLQWSDLKAYCHRKGIQFFGDIPIYVAYDSVDVWTHPDLFKLDEQKKPIYISGVPPDYFSENGQLWHNPVYRWDIVKKRKYAWWIERMRHNMILFDLMRVDHFRGFVAFWQVPAGETTAINGEWIEAPAMDFFTHLSKELPDLPIIAEDLGLITQDVQDVMDQFEFPGMRVIQFGFSGDLSTNDHLPHNLKKRCVLFTGTHDNNTVQGWFRQDATEAEKKNLEIYSGRKINKKTLHWDLIRLAMMSVADVVVVPMQDLLGLGGEARMNRPFINENNWLWRLKPNQVKAKLGEKLARLTTLSGRYPDAQNVVEQL